MLDGLSNVLAHSPTSTGRMATGSRHTEEGLYSHKDYLVIEWRVSIQLVPTKEVRMNFDGSMTPLEMFSQ